MRKAKPPSNSPRQLPLAELLFKCRGNRSYEDVEILFKNNDMLISRQRLHILERGKSKTSLCHHNDKQLEIYSIIYEKELTAELKNWGKELESSLNSKKTDPKIIILKVLIQLRNEQKYNQWRETKPVPETSTFFDLLQLSRETNNLTLGQAAKLLGTSESTLSRIENDKQGKNTLDLSQLLRLKEAYNIPLDGKQLLALKELYNITLHGMPSSKLKELYGITAAKLKKSGKLSKSMPTGIPPYAKRPDAGALPYTERLAAKDVIRKAGQTRCEKGQTPRAERLLGR